MARSRAGCGSPVQRHAYIASFLPVKPIEHGIEKGLRTVM